LTMCRFDNHGDSSRARTRNLIGVDDALYQLSYGIMVGEAGLAPAISWLWARQVNYCFTPLHLVAPP
jgi:hypothetical protein